MTDTNSEVDEIFAEVGRIYRTENLTQLDLEKLDQAKTSINQLLLKARCGELEEYLKKANPNFIDYEYIKPRIAEIEKEITL